MLALSAPSAWGQQFVEQQLTRFPQPPLNEYTNQVAFADIDGDGDLDIAFANGQGFSGAGAALKLRIFRNNGAGQFTDISDAATGGWSGWARDVEFGDVDGDGDLDMAVAQDFVNPPQLFLNNGSGIFTNVTLTHMPNVAISSSHCSFGDIDNDGDLDLVFNNGNTSRFGSGQTHLYRNDGTGHFTNVTAAQLPAQLVSQPMDVQFSDIDGDLDLDLLIASRALNGSKLYRNNGAGFFTDITAGNFPSANTVYGFDFGDYNGDGALDVLGANAKGGPEGLFQNDGTGKFTDVTAAVLPSNPSIDDNDTRFFDFDNDGDLDFIIASLSTTERAYVNNGTQLVLTGGIFQALTDSSLDIEVGDLDADGRLDIVTGQGESGSFLNRIYMNTGPTDTVAPKIVQVESILDTPSTAGPYVFRSVVRDGMTTDSNFFYDSIAAVYTVNGGSQQSLETRWYGGDIYRAALPGMPCGAVISYGIRAIDAAGNTATSSFKTFKILPPPAIDLNGDGKIDQSDLGEMLAHYGCVGGGCVGDVDSDGDVDQSDLGALLGIYGCGT